MSNTQAQQWFDKLKAAPCVTYEIINEDREYEADDALHSFHVFPDGSVYWESASWDYELGEWGDSGPRGVYPDPAALLEAFGDETAFADKIADFHAFADTSIKVYKALTQRDFTPANALEAIFANVNLIQDEEVPDIVEKLAGTRATV